MPVSRSLAIGAFLACTVVGGAQAGLTTLYGNLGNPFMGSGGYQAIAPFATTGDGPVAQSFSTGDSPDLALSDVRLRVERTDTTGLSENFTHAPTEPSQLGRRIFCAIDAGSRGRPGSRCSLPVASDDRRDRRVGKLYESVSAAPSYAFSVLAGEGRPAR